jgi:putative SOS response-associated peptidase YedK
LRSKRSSSTKGILQTTLKTTHWFALDETRPPFAFAGIWTAWRGVRGTAANPTEDEHKLFGFLTTEANVIVAPIHAKAIPVRLTTAEEWDIWLGAPWAEAAQLQRPLPAWMIRIVARGKNSDDLESTA